MENITQMSQDATSTQMKSFSREALINFMVENDIQPNSIPNEIIKMLNDGAEWVGVKMNNEYYTRKTLESARKVKNKIVFDSFGFGYRPDGSVSITFIYEGFLWVYKSTSSQLEFLLCNKVAWVRVDQ